MTSTESTRPHALFISFEGGEGAGKSSQVALLRERLEVAGCPVITTREPGGTPLAELLRQIIRKPAVARRFVRLLGDTGEWERISPRAELLLFAAARAQHVDALIRPALAAGTSVLCDRFAESTLAYQGYGRGLPRAELEQAIALATGGLRPDLIVLLDVPVEVGLARKQGEAGRDQIGQETRDFHERVRHGYLALAAEEPARWLILDATLPPDDLSARIWQRVTALGVGAPAPAQQRTD